MRKLAITYHLPILLTTLFIICGCTGSEDILPTSPRTAVEGKEIMAYFDITCHISGSSSMTRADEQLLNGTDAENAIKALTLFVVNENNAIELIEDVPVASLSTDNGKSKATVSIKTTTGNKQIYIGVNFSDDMKSTFLNEYNRNQTKASHQLPYLEGNKIPLFMTKIAGSEFMMTGQAHTSANNNTITIDDETASSIQIQASLTRVVSKVLLTCTSITTNGNEFVSNVDNGYIKREDVHYTLNTLNRKFYFLEQSNGEDPNYDLSLFFNSKGETTNATSDDFAPINDDITDIANIVNGNVEQAAKFDASRISQNGDNRYNEGIYCTENTINDDLGWSNELKEEKPRAVTTYIIIGFKFTPKYIYDSSTKKEKTYSYANAVALMSQQGNTFFTHKSAPKAKQRICYLSYKDLKEAYDIVDPDNSLIDTYAIEHTNGWVTNKSYINGDNTDGKLLFSNNSGIQRNNYYIMKLTGVKWPVTSAKTIEVNTKTYGWTAKGKTTIDVETGNE